MAMATLSFVPMPSALETSTGSFHFLRSSAKSAPKLPMPPSTPGVNVRLAWWRILCFASSATAMSTPASAYFMGDLLASSSVSVAVSSPGAPLRPSFALRNSFERRGGCRGRFAGANGVVFNEFLAVDPDGAVAEIDGVAREADDAFDVVRLIGGERRLEDDDLLALGIAPQGHVPIGEGHARIVPDAAHDEVIADEQCVLHRAGTNDARLPDRAVDEQKGEADPEPGDDLALNLCFHRYVCFFLFAQFFSLHVPPPPAALRARIHCPCQE